MSFDNSSQSFIHLVNWPSTWLPPISSTNSITHKLLVIGLKNQEDLNAVVETIQKNYHPENWALYVDLEFDINSPEHLDWLLINSKHCEGAWCSIQTEQDLAIALSLNIPVFIENISNPEWKKIVNFSRVKQSSNIFSRLIEQSKKEE